MVKITSGTWKCVIPHCKSRARAPGHYFPKDTKLRKKWIKAISMSHVPDEKIKKCRICHLHFDESSYVINLQRRRLKIDAIPNQNLPTRNETDNSESDTSTDLEEEEEEEDEENEDEEMDDPQYDEVTGTIAPQSFLDVYKSYVRTVKHKVILGNNVDIEEQTRQETQLCNNVNIEEGTQQETQPEIVRTPNRSFHSTNHVHRNILVTRKANLTPVARKIYIKNRLFKKQKIFYARILIINND